MKSRINKILGVAVTLAIMASLMVTGTALPASAAAGTLAYGVVSTPSMVGNVLVAGKSADLIASNADGSAMFLFDNTTGALFKSTNSGVTWAARPAGTVGLPLATAAVGMAISPTFATDNTVVVVEAAKVWISTDGGNNFYEVATADLATKMEGAGSAITSVDMGAYYANGRMNILIGCKNGAATIYSNVLRFDTSAAYGTWVEVGGLKAGVTATAGAVTVGAGGVITAIALGGGGTAYDVPPAVTITQAGASGATAVATINTTTGAVTGFTITSGGTGYTAAATVVVAAPGMGSFSAYAVKFSPNHIADSEILAVVDDGAKAVLYSRFASGMFGNALNFAAATNPVVSAVIGLGTDFNGLSTNTLAVGVDAAAGDGLYRVVGRTSTTSPTAPTAVATVATAVNSLAINGPIASGTMVVGLKASSTVWRCSTFTATTATFTAATKAPTGAAAPCSVMLAGTNIYAATTGVDGAFSVSADGGINFNQLSFINVGTVANMSLGQLTTIDNSNMFLVMNNATGGYAAQHLYVTADGGTTWTRVLVSGMSGLARIGSVAASPNYATDKTVFVSQGTSAGATPMIGKSVDNGTSFTGMIGVDLQTAFKAIDGTSYYYGGTTTASFYKYGRWASGAFPAGTTGNVVSIAIDPKDATGATIAVGMSSGNVYKSTDDGLNFTRVGTTGPVTTQNAMIAYGPDGTLYALGSGLGGVNRWTGSAWLNIKTIVAGTSAGGSGVGLAVTADGTLYAADTAIDIATLVLPITSKGIYRSLYPTKGDTTSVTACEFQSLDSNNIPTWLNTYVAAALNVVNTSTENTLYVTETTTAAGTTYGYAGRIYGFKDTFIAAPVLTSPADKTQITTETTAALAWTAVTSATAYEVEVDTLSTFAGTNQTISTVSAIGAITNGRKTNSATATGLTAGNTYYWRIRAISTDVNAALNNLNGRWSSGRSFINALTPPAVTTVQIPNMGAVDVPIDTTFTWPANAAAGATYEFVIAEELGNTDKFAIIDYSATTTVNAHKLREDLKYDTQYWWRVRAVTATSKSDWTTGFFTTKKEPVATTGTTTPVTQTIVVPTQQPVTPIVTVTNLPQETQEVIPTYLIWAVIAVGAILIIAVIVLIVRTRRIS
ncbi:MAG: fibronectin type III domain-containing protein [Dehalococcoidales bacterium]|nr:fibronectin type III domain-containing protein [Dehalococcoidales bacterium]